MRLCFDREGREVAVLVWREEELRLIGREAREVQGVDEENAEKNSKKVLITLKSTTKLNL